MFSLKKCFCIIMFYFIPALFILKFVADPLVPLCWRDGVLIILFMCLLHSLIKIRILLNEASQKYKAHSKVLSDILDSSSCSAILNNFPFIVYLKDTDGKFVAGNEKLEKCIDLKCEQIIGMFPEDVFIQECPAAVKKDDKKVLRNRETVIKEYINTKLKQGNVWWRVIKAPVLGQKNEPIGIIVVIIDITEEKELSRQRETFVATLTHDLKTPTKAQISASNLLLKGDIGELNDNQKEILEQIKNSNVYMDNMIATILATYKSEGSELLLNIEKFDICKLAHETCNELTPLAETRNQKLVINSHIHDSMVQADLLQLKRAITNLISNAIIYGFENTDVNIDISEKRNKVFVDVRNKARYIEKEKLAEVFEKYKTTKNALSNRASTGLGLYLSKKIVQKHGGEIYASSNKNQTCLFGFSIPHRIKAAKSAVSKSVL